MISCFLSSVQAKPPHVSSTRRLGNRQIHFLTSYVWRIWDRSRHFFELLMCAVPIYWDLRQFGICRHLCRGCGSPGDLQYPGYYQRVDRDMIHFAYPSLSKGLLMLGSMVRFPFHKGYCGKPAHHTGVSTLHIPPPSHQVAVPDPAPFAAYFYPWSSYHTKADKSIYSGK